MKRLKVYLGTLLVFCTPMMLPKRKILPLNYFTQYEVYVSNLALAEINNTVNKDLKNKLINAIENILCRSSRYRKISRNLFFHLPIYISTNR
jgi:hypothetical protein